MKFLCGGEGLRRVVKGTRRVLGLEEGGEGGLKRRVRLRPGGGDGNGNKLRVLRDY